MCFDLKMNCFAGIIPAHLLSPTENESEKDLSIQEELECPYLAKLMFLYSLHLLLIFFFFFFFRVEGESNFFFNFMFVKIFKTGNT